MEKIWLIGTGVMGGEYAKVLIALDVEFLAIGRGSENALKFEKQTMHPAIQGGLKGFLESKPEIPAAVIVAVGMEMLAQTTHLLLDYGIKKILLEKPGCLNYPEIDALSAEAEKNNAKVLIAYNRRFYSSVMKAEEIIKEDGGVTSFTFEFTEWSHIIETLDKPCDVLRNWFLGNSTHVIDTAFFLGGKPKALHALHKGGTKWHPAASIFAGAGESESGALFSYHANWDAPGRWVIEMLTRQHRLIFKPMERLQIQNLGSVEINPVMIDESLDKDYKPGLYLQTKAFLENDHERYCTLNEQRENIENFYIPMSGYSLDQKPTYSLFTVIIPTYNRPEYLKKILSYYLSFGIKIIVVDASDEVFPYLSLYGNQIEYRHTPNKHIVERVNEIASLIYTPYVLFCADDDFIVPDAINSIVAFLEKNPDYSFGEGYILRFSRKNNDIMIAASYRHMLGEKITEDSPDKRILHLMNNFFSVCYSVYRTDILKEMYKSMLFNNKILIKQSYLIELYISVYPLIEGKLIVLPLLYQARETIWNSLGSTDSNIHAIVTKKRYRKDYNECVRLLAAHLSRKEGISFDNAKNIVEEAVMRFLNNVFPGYYTIKRRIIPEIKDRIKEFLKALLRIIGLYDHVKNIVDKYRLKHGIAINAAMPVDSLDTQDMEQWNKIRDYIIQSKASNR